ncbi:MAG: N-6 DNA methylase [Candidatus Lokiarchaeota archaeon]|nr:N-6 DNA methylase [Candidatus Lokiarchaeota archaeon]
MCKKVIYESIFEDLNINFEKLNQFKLENRESRDKIFQRLNNIKILDPACGEGAFLIPAAQILHTIRHKLQKSLGISIKESEIKKGIVKKNIYGVDSHENAIKNVKKKLYSWIFTNNEGNADIPLNENNSREVNKDLKLNRNLIVGNSLRDIFFPDLLSNGGFDIVIGNPPYIDSEEMTKSNSELRAFCSEKYKVAQGNWDVFCVFIELGLERYLKDGGRLTYVIPNKLLSSEYARETRSLMKQYKIDCIRDYSGVDIFGVSVYPIVIFLRKEPNIGKEKVLVEKIGFSDAEEIKIMKSDEIDIEYFINNDNWSISLDTDRKKIDLESKETIELGNFCEIYGAATVSEAYEIKKILKELENEELSSYFKFINTGTIDKHKKLWGIKKTRYIKKSYKKPIILKDNLRKILPNRYDQAKSEKIIVAGLTKALEAVYDEGKYLAGKSTVIILNKKENNFNLRYLTALINSSIVSYIYKMEFGNLTLRGGYFRVGPPQIKRLKIPKKLLTDTSLKEKIIELLDIPDEDGSLKRIDDIIFEILKCGNREKKII